MGSVELLFLVELFMLSLKNENYPTSEEIGSKKAQVSKQFFTTNLVKIAVKGLGSSLFGMVPPLNLLGYLHQLGTVQLSQISTSTFYLMLHQSVPQSSLPYQGWQDTQK
mmetsp:Transcript_1339/g.2084  ORF Transcript_1339/g.2084 Transcript_1339/m.2084 type:complete len:109 (+) Transcript_1339:20-346(+)